MLINPPIDKLVDKAECKYALVCLITKRARFLLDKKPDLLADGEKSAVSYASEEFLSDVIGMTSE